MTATRPSAVSASGCHVVGVISTRDGLRQLTTASADCDLVEVRVDMLLKQGVELAEVAHSLVHRNAPVLLTPRVLAEGGNYPWARGERLRAARTLIPSAEVWDVESRHWSAVQATRDWAGQQGVRCLMSSHVFHRELEVDALRARVRQLLERRAWVHKLAVCCDSLMALNALLQVQGEFAGHRVALMGMGRLGKESREQLPWVGSRLVYGFLDCPIVPGQSPAGELCRVLAPVRAPFPT